MFLIASVGAGFVALLLMRSWAGSPAASTVTVGATFLAVLFLAWDGYRNYLVDCLYLALRLARGANPDARSFARSKWWFIGFGPNFKALPPLLLESIALGFWSDAWLAAILAAALVAIALLTSLPALWLARYRIQLRLGLAAWVGEPRRESLLHASLDEDPDVRQVGLTSASS